MTMLYLKNTCPRASVWETFDYHYYTLSLSDLCLRVVKKIYDLKNASSQFLLNEHALALEPLPRVHAVI